MSLRPNLAAAIIVVAALWLAIAAFLSFVAIMRTRRAEALLRAAQDWKGLLDAAPSRPLVVAPDGAIEADHMLVQLLGLDSIPKKLDDLAPDGRGIDGADLEALRSDLAASALGGKPVLRQLRIAGSDRAVEARGTLAPPPAKAGTLLLWLSDVSEMSRERGAIGERLEQTEQALDALTHLIESAPFPMWYRGPDLSLGLVNSAFVAAVSARDAAEVVARGSELIDGGGEEGARSGAQRAIELGGAYSRNQPATIGEERRMLRLVDVPLPGGGVAGFAIDIQELEDARTE